MQFRIRECSGRSQGLLGGVEHYRWREKENLISRFHLPFIFVGDDIDTLVCFCIVTEAGSVKSVVLPS